MQAEEGLQDGSVSASAVVETRCGDAISRVRIEISAFFIKRRLCQALDERPMCTGMGFGNRKFVFRPESRSMDGLRENAPIDEHRTKQYNDDFIQYRLPCT